MTRRLVRLVLFQIFFCISACFSFSSLLAQDHYQIIHAPGITWTQARDSAVALGGQLVTITSSQEQIMVGGLISTNGWWIGATDQNTEGQWEWVTGEQWGYTNWYTGEPNNSGNEDAAYLNADLNDAWVDGAISKNDLAGFILELPNVGAFPQNLKLLDSVDEQFINSATPTIVWEYSGSGDPQTAYEIEVGTDTDWSVAEMWATGEVSSSDTSFVYAGLPLVSQTLYYMRVRLNNGAGWGTWNLRFFTYVDIPSATYQVVSALGKTWEEANTMAMAMGGHLVTITSADEQFYVGGLANSGIWWIGATEADSAGDWSWVTNEPWSYTNWSAGEPNNGIAENAATLQPSADDQWVDYYENRTGVAGFILEIDGDGYYAPFPGNLNIVNSINNKFIFDSIPVFQWKNPYPSEQTEYEIAIGADKDWLTAEIWNPGPAASTDTFTVYDGLPFVPNQVYYGRIRLRDSLNWGFWTNFSFRYHDLSQEPAYIPIQTKGITWSQARDSANALSGYLTTITNAQEQQKVSSILTFGFWWIGATDEIISGQWRWVTGESWSYTNWFPGEDLVGNEHYVYLTYAGAGQWLNTINNAQLTGFILEIPIRKPYAIGLGFTNSYVAPYVGSTTPTIAWQYNNFYDTEQTQYEIEIGTDSSWTTGVVWSSGTVMSSDTQAAYTGMPLSEDIPYFLRVRVSDSLETGPWSQISFFVFDLTKHTYELVQTNKNWLGAYDAAQAANGYLVTITNPLEEFVIRNLLPNPFDFYAGGTDEVVEEAWSWITDEPFQYTHWAPNEPNNAGGSEDFIEVHGDGQWNDVNGTNSLWFVIERDLTARIPVIMFDGKPRNTHVISDFPKITWLRTSDTLIQDSVEIEIGINKEWTIAELWNPPVLHTSDSFVTYAGNPLQDGITYQCRIRVAYGNIWTPWSYTNFHMNAKPIPPVLPASMPVYTTRTPVLQIPSGNDGEKDSLTYFFDGYYDSSLSVPAGYDTSEPFAIGQMADLAIHLPLNDNSIVWWRTRVFDGYEYSMWSNTGKLVINTEPEQPSIPTLISPSDQPGMPVFDLTPTMKWFAIDPDPMDTIWYTLEVAADSHFVFVRVFDSLESEEFEFPDSLGFNKQYWWRVTSYNPNGLSLGASDGKSFYTWMLGDVNHSQSVTVQDLVMLVSYLFNNGPVPTPLFVGDLNSSCTVTIADLVYLVQYLFNSGPAPKVGCGP